MTDMALNDAILALNSQIDELQRNLGAVEQRMAESRSDAARYAALRREVTEAIAELDEVISHG